MKIKKQNIKNTKQNNGFTLIELLIALAIISILACISYPVYTEHLVKARRANAAIALFDLASRLEQFYAQNNSYLNATLDNLGFNQANIKNYYEIKLSTTTDSYSLQANPLENQAKSDQECEALMLDQNGNKSISGNGKIENCW